MERTRTKLRTLQNSNPKKFWDLFKNLKEYDKQVKSNPIPTSKWVSHFSGLMNKSLKIDSNFEEELRNYIQINKNKVFSEINFKITESEISKAINKLKNNKASGPDGILNEMIKSGGSFIVPVICKLFNLILTHGTFPNAWRANTLTPLHKKGDKLITDNYRGIAVCSNFCKLFCSVLHNRLSIFARENKLIPGCQIGYREKSRTSDHILTLKNLIDKYLRKQKSSYLYTCFVDFKAAFDSVWRTALIYKILKCDIGGNILNVIQNMYKEVIYHIKLPGGLTEGIPSNLGVKQGCVLSPLLFNIFLSDLPDIFDASCDPVTIFDSPYSCLMFADDIILISETSSGLQNSLNKLKLYCEKWHLTVNTNKTKIMIFNKGGRKLNKTSFYFGKTQIDLVQQYCYLGITFCASGSFKYAVNNLYDKALKAFFSLKQFDIRNNIKVALKLFQTLVMPIIRYGCEVWSPFYLNKVNDSNFIDLCEKFPMETINNKLCKYLLGVHRNSTNLAVKGELGKHPLLIECLYQSLNFWMRTSNVTPDSVVKKSFLDSLISKPLETSWVQCIFKIITQFGFNNLWENQYFMSGSHYSKPVRDLMILKYEKDWLSRINRNTPTESGKGKNKLRTYCTIKKSFEMENYVISQQFKNRRVFSKLRISAHNLHIETGRYDNTPADLRYCLFCKDSKNNNVVEDEQHFVLSCPLYVEERINMFDQLETISSHNLKEDNETFVLLMNVSNGDHDFTKVICPYINKCYEKRSSWVEKFERTNKTQSKRKKSKQVIRQSPDFTPMYVGIFVFLTFKNVFMKSWSQNVTVL